jgi:hypothetical protein
MILTTLGLVLIGAASLLDFSFRTRMTHQRAGRKNGCE